MRPARVHVSSRSTESRYAYGFVCNDSRLSTLYIVPVAMNEMPAPASRAIGTANPAVTSIDDEAADRNAIFRSPSLNHLMRRPWSAAFRFEIAGATSLV